MTVERYSSREQAPPHSSLGKSLQDWLKVHTFSPKEILVLMKQVVQSLAPLHRSQKIYQRLTPWNVIWNPEAQTVDLLRLDHVAKSAAEETLVIHTPSTENSLLYRSPEQSGRLSQKLDHRSDFYALGALAWHMLVGHPLFHNKEPQAILHAHLAQRPEPPHHYRDDVPLFLSEIILKLLAKQPEERYQTTHGLLLDLEQGHRVLESGTGASFALGQHDQFLHRLYVERLYGREQEQEQLRKALARAQEGGFAFVWVQGAPGVGKTTLVQSLTESTFQSQGHFARGRFESLQREIPYLAFQRALRSLLQHLLTEEKSRLLYWRTRLQQALSGNDSVLLPLLPELGYLLGETSVATHLPALEERIRIQKSFSDLIQALSAPQHPLVLYLDDLQWVDSASLELIEFLAANQTLKGLLLIGGYRNTESDRSEHLINLLRTMEERQIPATSIALENLSLKDIQLLLGELLQTAQDLVESAARILWTKTAGNPFFVKVLLQQSYQEGLLWREGSSWRWDEKQLQTLAVTDNVVALLVESLQQQPEERQRALQLAACLGRRFQVTHLQTLLKLSHDELMQLLQPSLEQHLLEDLEGDWLRFTHDRIQEAAYALLPDEQKIETHRMIGQHLLQHSDLDKEPDLLFELVRHFQQGHAHTLPTAEKAPLIALALSAGKRAQQAGAFEAAFTHLDWGIQLVGPERWAQSYATTLELVSQIVSIGTAYRQREHLDRYIDELIQHGRTLTDQLPAWKSKILLLMGEHRMQEALDMTNRFFALTGTPQIKPYHPLRMLWEVVRLYLRLRWVKVEDLQQLPSVEDPLRRGILDLQVQVSPAYHLDNPQLIPTMILRDIWGTLDHGVTDYNVQCWTGWGVILSTFFNQVDTGIRFGKLSVQEARRMQRPDLEPHFETLHYYTSEHLLSSYTTLTEKFLDASNKAFQAGNLPAAFLSRLISVGCSYFAGHTLPTWEGKIDQYSQLLTHYKYSFGHNEIHLFRSYCTTLQKDSLPTDLVIDTGPLISSKSYTLQWLWPCVELQFFLLTEQYEKAIAVIQSSYREMLTPANAILQGPFWSYAINAIYACTKKDWSTRWNNWWLLRLGWRALRKWCRHLPASREYHLHWLNAARLRSRGRMFQALEYYDKALIQAKQAGNTQDAGIIAEQAASLCASQKHHRMARDFRREAIQHYQTWGATAKVNQLVQLEPSLLPAPQRVEEAETLQSGERKRSSDTNPRSFELNAALKAAEALSHETDETTLLHRLMQLLMEHAGAERGLLFLYRNASCRLMAQMEHTDPTCLVPDTVMTLDDESSIVSTAMLRYTILSHQPVVLTDASEEGPFVRDPYITSAKVRSVLCLPILAHNQLIGLVYLENRLTTGVFTQQRQDLLSLIATQAAVSLQWLYSQSSGEMSSPQLPKVTGDSRPVRPQQTMDEPLLQTPMLVRSTPQQLSPIGLNVGDWNVTREIGKGGMSVIYESHNIYTGQRAALKLLGPEYSQQELRARRFQREAQILERFNHPHIISQLDVDVDPQFGSFMALEYLQGETLQTVLERHSPLPLGWLLAISEQLCEALNVVHQESIIHRDLKPSNVFLCNNEPFPRVCLIDFGIADTSKLSTETRLTQTGMIVGTPAYLAPEQLKEKVQLTPATDLYALGVIWFEALTGRHPLGGGASAELFVKILQNEPASLGQVRPSFQGTELESLLLQLLAKNPKERPDNVEVVWNEFAMGAQFLEDPFDTPERYPTLRKT